MKAKQFFILVSDNLKSRFYKTEKSVRMNLEKSPFQKKFSFDNEKEALQFQQQITQCSGIETFKQLEFDYGIAQQLKSYEQKIMNRKAFREDDVTAQGISINLRRPTHIYVLWDKTSKPQIYFGGATAKKNQKPETEMRQFLQPDEAITYIKQILEFVEKNKTNEDNSQNNESEQNNANHTFLQNEEAKLFSLDLQYKELLPKHMLQQMKEVNVNYSQNYAFRCSSFNTLHFHSSIGVSLIDLQSEQVIKNQGIYVSQRKPSGLLLLSVLFGLRYSIFLQIPSITFQLAASQDYQLLNQMSQPSQPLQKMTLNAINNYSELMKSVKFQLVEKEDCEEAYIAAVKAFEKSAYLRQRSRKFRHQKSDD